MSSVLVFCCCWCCCCGCFWCCRRRKTSSAVIYSNRLEESRQEKNRASRYTAPWANALDALVDPLERRGRRCLCARMKHGRTHPYSRRRCLLLFIIIPLDELFHLNWTLKPYSHIQQRYTHTHTKARRACASARDNVIIMSQLLEVEECAREQHKSAHGTFYLCPYNCRHAFYATWKFSFMLLFRESIEVPLHNNRKQTVKTTTMNLFWLLTIDVCAVAWFVWFVCTKKHAHKQ